LRVLRGSSRSLISCCKAYSVQIHTVLVTGSSPVAPTIFLKALPGICRKAPSTNLPQHCTISLPDPFPKECALPPPWFLRFEVVPDLSSFRGRVTREPPGRGLLSRPSDHWNLFASTGLYAPATMFPSLITGCDLNRGLVSRGHDDSAHAGLGTNLSIADFHVSLCQVERALLLARTGERAHPSFLELTVRTGASRQGFLPSQNRTSIPCLKPSRPSQKLELVFAASPETIRREPQE